MTEQDVDVEELRGDLQEIKQAMGLTERYDGASSLWLLFGVAVPVAAALSQYVHLEQLPAWYHTLVWAVVIGGAFGLYVVVTDEAFERTGGLRGKPNLWVQFAVVYLASIPLQSIAGSYTGELGYVAESAMVLSIIVVMIGVAYGVFGASLAAYHVRRRDRWIFYVGAIWMVALGVAIPQSATLETWAYAVYGGCYFAYAAGAYLVLRRGGDGD